MGRTGRSGASTPVLVLSGVVLLLAVGIVLAIMLSPDKPEAPPPSSTSYVERPNATRDSSPESAWSEDEAAFANADMDATGENPTETAILSGGDYRILGAVTNKLDRSPLASAHVRLAIVTANPEEQKPQVVETGEDGSFEARLSVAGNYQIVATMNGFIPSEPASIFVGPDQTEQRVDFSLGTGATISGRVTEGRSSVGAKEVPVMVLAPNNAVLAQTLTDDTGRYQLGGLLPGTFQVTLRLENTEYKPGEVLPYERVTINSPDDARQNVNFSVQAAGVVWGYATDTKRNPVPGARVVLVTSNSVLSQFLTAAINQALPISDEAEEDGYYELLGVPLNKEWKLYATSENFSPQLAKPFVLSETNRSVRVDIYMFGGTDVTGRVVDNDGIGVAAAQVRCIPSLSDLTSPLANAQAFRDGRSDEQGFFKIEQLPAGNYQILAHKKGYKFALGGEPIYPDGYSGISGVILRLESVGSGVHNCYGTIYTADGQTLDGVEVNLEGLGTDSMSGVEMSTTTGSGGKFRFEGIEAGVYQLIARKEGFSPYTAPRALLDKEMEIVMQTTAVVRGKVIAANGGTLANGYTVSAAKVNEAGGISLAGLAEVQNEVDFNNPDGSYELYVPAGDYRIEARAQGYTPGREFVSLQSAEERDGVDIVLPDEGGTISGIVTTISGGSPQGTTLLLFEGGSPSAGGGGGTQETRVAEDGIFSFENLPAGNYTVIAQHAAFANGSSGPIMLSLGERRDDVVIRLGAGGVLVGTVRRQGQVMADAMVTIVGTDTGTTRSVQTDGSGYYEADGLGTGNYQVAVTNIGSGGGFGGLTEAFSNTVFVTEGETSRLDFGSGVGTVINGTTSRPPTASLVPTGYALLVPAEMGPLGDTINIDALRVTRATAVGMGGQFTFEDVYAGAYFLQVFYADSVFSLETLRNMYTELIIVEEGQPAMNIPVPIGF